MDIEIIVESNCPGCHYPIKVVTKEYMLHNRDGTLHTCYGDEDLTYTDCPYYTRVSCGDEAFSRCALKTNRLCDADEAGLECVIWEEEKAEIIKDEHNTSSQSS